MRISIDSLRMVLGSLCGLAIGWVLLSPVVFAFGMVPGLALLSPNDGANVSGIVTMTAVADSSGLTSLQFQLDGAAYGQRITSGPCQALFDTRAAADGPHTVQAVATDEFGNTVTSRPATVFVNNLAPAISGLAATNVSSSSALIVWTTASPGDSQVEYGFTVSYGSATSRDYALVQSHAQTLTGLTPGRTYHVRARSVAENGMLSVSSDLAFTTSTATTSPTPTPPPGGCRTPDPFVAFGGGVCVNGDWHFPETATVAPAPVPAPTPAATPTGCSTPDPFVAFGGGICVNGDWRFPDTPAPLPAPVPTPTPTPSATGGCATPDPFVAFGGGVCVNGEWRFPDNPGAAPAPVPAPNPTPTASGNVPAGYTQCARQGGFCSFSGTMIVAYGANGTFTYRTLAGGTSCSNTVFGNPVPGVSKYCSIRPPG